MGKAKAGKQKRKAPVRRHRNAAPKQVAPAAVKVERTFPCKVIVSKGSERLPVEVKDAAHHAQLVEQFGESSIEVLS